MTLGACYGQGCRWLEETLLQNSVPHRLAVLTVPTPLRAGWQWMFLKPKVARGRDHVSPSVSTLPEAIQTIANRRYEAERPQRSPWIDLDSGHARRGMSRRRSLVGWRERPPSIGRPFARCITGCVYRAHRRLPVATLREPLLARPASPPRLRWLTAPLHAPASPASASASVSARAALPAHGRHRPRARVRSRPRQSRARRLADRPAPGACRGCARPGGRQGCRQSRRPAPTRRTRRTRQSRAHRCVRVHTSALASVPLVRMPTIQLGRTRGTTLPPTSINVPRIAVRSWNAHVGHPVARPRKAM